MGGAQQWKNEPAPGVTAALAAMFAAAPALANGIAAGIKLHVDAGSGLDAIGNPFSQNMGTGKYEGMQQTTTVVMMPPMKDAKPGTFQGCNRQSGTYKLK